MAISNLSEAQEAVRHFAEERDWDRFHGAKDLAIGLITEASEFLELFRFRNDDECLEVLAHAAGREKVEDELADCFFFLLRFSQKFNIDLFSALERKLEKNRQKYPVEKSRGRNLKYDEL